MKKKSKYKAVLLTIDEILLIAECLKVHRLENGDNIVSSLQELEMDLRMVANNKL